MTLPKKIPSAPVFVADQNNSRISPLDLEKYKDKTMEEILVDLADSSKTSIAGAILAGAQAADPSALKILQTIMERQGGGLQKELPISNAQFKEIIRIAYRELVFEE